jgi:pyruvate carboxylase subunit B
MVRLTDTSFRDAHQSLLATRFRTRDMLPICEKMDRVGFFSLEVWGGATFDSCIRFLNENPWERLRALRKAMPNTQLQMLLRGQNLVGYRHYSDDIAEKFVVLSARNGVDIFRIFDALNDVRNMEFTIKIAKREGKHVQGAVSYTLSPVHTTEKFVAMFKRLAELGCDSLCIKDMAGLINPAGVKELVRAIKKEVGLPIDLHSHSTAGLAPISYLAAAEAGCDVLDTAMSPVSGGTSQPATETIVAALAGTEWDTRLDMALLLEIKEYFARMREKYRALIDPISERVDTAVLYYQIPGGMLSNLVSQLKQQNALDKYDAVLKETPRVRQDLGYPPLVTPTSQIVGTQAVFNVLSGERYKMVSKEVKDYVRGAYGRTPAPISDEIRKKIIGDEQPITVRPADLLKPEWPAVVEEGQKLGFGDDEEKLVMYAIYPQVATAFLKGECKEEALMCEGPKPAPAEASPVRPADPAAPPSVTPAPPLQEKAQLPESPQRPVFGPRQYKVRVGEKLFDVAVEEQAAELSSKPPVWFPFGISRSTGAAAPAAPVQYRGAPAAGGTIMIARAGATPAAHPAAEAVRPPAPHYQHPPQRKIPPSAPHPAAEAPASNETGGLKKGEVVSPMQGTILRLNCAVGDRVSSGQVLAILEAMKMENEIPAPSAGTVREIKVKKGEQVAPGQAIILLDAS